MSDPIFDPTNKPKVVSKILIRKGGGSDPTIVIKLENYTEGDPIFLDRWQTAPGNHQLIGPNQVTILSKEKIDSVTHISGTIALTPPFTEDTPKGGLDYAVDVFVGNPLVEVLLGIPQPICNIEIFL